MAAVGEGELARVPGGDAAAYMRGEGAGGWRVEATWRARALSMPDLVLLPTCKGGGRWGRRTPSGKGKTARYWVWSLVELGHTVRERREGAGLDG